MDYRLCCMCKNNLPENRFSKDRTKEDGLAVRCKDCDSLLYHLRKQKREGRIDFVVNKQCTKCKTEKPASEFGVYAVAVDKLRSECKQCRRKPAVIEGVTLTAGEIRYGPTSSSENGVYIVSE